MSNVSSSNSHKEYRPKLRFKEFTDSWSTATLGELGTFTKGAPLSKADISTEGTPFILYGELYTTYKEVANHIVRKTQKTADNECLSRIGDVIIPTSGETPEEIATATCVMLPDVILAGDLNIYRNNTIDGRIVSYIINHVVNADISRIAQGKSVVHIKADELAKIQIHYPTAREQTKLLNFLHLLDAKIEKQQILVERIKSYKRGALQSIKVPTKTYCVGQIFNITRGYVLPTSNVLEQKSIANCYPVYSSQTKNDGLMGYFNQYLYENAITWTTDGANAGYTRYRDGKFYCTNVCGVLINDEGYANEFVAEKINEISKKYVSYVGNPKLMNNVMAEIKIDLPTLEKQQHYSKLIDLLNKTIDYNSKILKNLADIKRALLQQLFI